jgi:hypothetical protein
LELSYLGFDATVDGSQLPQRLEEKAVTVDGRLCLVGLCRREVVTLVAAGGLDGEKEVRPMAFTAGAGTAFLPASAEHDAEGSSEQLAQIQDGLDVRGSFGIQRGDFLAYRARLLCASCTAHIASQSYCDYTKSTIRIKAKTQPPEKKSGQAGFRPMPAPFPHGLRDPKTAGKTSLIAP